jgi:hypothetical protein
MMTEDAIRDAYEKCMRVHLFSGDFSLDYWAEHNQTVTEFQQYLLMKIGVQRFPEAECRKRARQRAIDMADGMVPEELAVANAVAVGFDYGYRVACEDMNDPRLPGGPYIV